MGKRSAAELELTGTYAIVIRMTKHGDGGKPNRPGFVGSDRAGSVSQLVEVGARERALAGLDLVDHP